MTYINPVTDYDLWVAARGLGIGGSEAGVLMRWNQYSNVTKLWRLKTGQERDDFVGNQYTEWGSELEPAVLHRYARHRQVPVLGRTVGGNPVIFWPEEGREPDLLDPDQYWGLVQWLNPVVSPLRTYARANVDGYTLDQAASRITRMLEVKTTLASNRNKWGWDFPATYYAQCLHNNLILRENGIDVPSEITVLVGGNDWGILKVKERAHLIDELKRREERFWYCVEENVKPRVQAWFPRITPPSEEDDEMAERVKARQSGGGGPDIPPAPAGSKHGVCVDLVDRGEKEQEWQGKKRMVSKISLHFLLPTCLIPAEVDGEALPEKIAGKPSMVSKWFTNSLHEASGLRKFLKGWRGFDLTPEEEALHKADELYVDDLVLGRNAILGISHAHKNDRTYANIDSAQGLMEGMTEYPVPADWIRFADRDAAAAEEPSLPAPAGATAGEPDLPWDK